MPQLFAQGALFALQASLAGAVQGQFIFGQLWCLAQNLLRHGDRTAFGFGSQALDTGDQGQPIGFGLALIGKKAGVIQAHQHITLFHHLPFAHENLGDDAAFKVLDHLHLAGGNGLAFAGGDFFQDGEIGPQQSGNQAGANHPDRYPGKPGGVFQNGAVDFRHKLGVLLVFAQAAKILAE